MRLLSWFWSRWLWGGLAVIVLASGWFASYRLAEPAWEMNHQGYILSEWSHNAANYLRFGIPATRTGLAMDYGWIRPENGLTYRVDHPPMTSWLIGVSYFLLGIHEWSARLVPLLFSLGLVVLVFVFAGQVGAGRWALLAAAFAAFNPGLLYYARLPVPHVPAVFFALLVFVLYRAWLEKSDRRYLLAMWAGFVIGAWTDWIVYFVMPWVILHYLLFHYRRQRDRAFVLVSLALPLACFASHLVWAYLVAGRPALLKLMEIYQLRSSGATTSGGLTGSELYQLTYGWTKLYLTSILCALSLVWVVSAVARAMKQRPRGDQFLISSLFLFGLTHNLMFRNRVYNHDFAMTFQWIPFFAVAGTLGVRTLARCAPFRWRWVVNVALVLVALGAFGLQSAHAVAGLHTEKTDPDLYLVGRRVDEIAPKEARIMSSFTPDFRLRYYMDRPFDAVRSLADFETRLSAGSHYSQYVLGPGSPGLPEDLRRRLAQSFPVQNVGEYAIFDLRSGQGPLVLADPGAAPPNAVQIQFGDSLALVGYEVAQVAVPPAVTPMQLGLRQHFNAHTEFMPEYGRQLKVMYYWKCLKTMPHDYVLDAILESEYGDTISVSDGRPVGGSVYPTSLWRPGDVVREERLVTAPAELPALRYHLLVKVSDPGGNIVTPQGPDVNGDSVALGFVDIAPATGGPVGSAEAPAMPERLTADLGDNLALKGYGLSSRTMAAGQSLKVETAWLARGPMSGDHPVWVELAAEKALGKTSPGTAPGQAGRASLRALLGVEPTRLWQAGQYYVRRGELAVSSYWLPGRYEMWLTRGAGQPRVSLGEVEVTWPPSGRWVLGQVGLPNGAKGDVPPLDTDRPLQVKFGLARLMDMEVVASWVGEALCADTRVEVYIKNSGGERYLGTWEVPRGPGTVTRLAIPRVVTAAGENVVSLRVPAARPKPHDVGWRAWVDAALPDLLYDASGPHDGWIWADYVEVNAGQLEAEWAAYRDLAGIYAGLGQVQEVSRLFRTARQAGLRPGQVEDLNVFLTTAGDGSEIGPEVDTLVHSMVPHWAGVNLGDKLEYLGYGLRRLDEGRGQLTLYFRTLTALDGDYAVWLHQTDEGGDKQVGLDHSLKTSQWKVGDLHADVQTVELGSGKVRFVFGLWRGDEASRLTVKDQPGQHEIDLGWIEVD